MPQNSRPSFLTLPLPSFKLTLMGYVPASQNALKGAHWTAMYHEKKRAALALRLALLSSVEGPVIGTTISPSLCRTSLSLLDSYMQTAGVTLVGASVRVKFQRKARSAPK